MSKPFNELRERLLRAGVAPRHVRRYLKELADHLADLREEEKVAGRSLQDAESAALARLGSIDGPSSPKAIRRLRARGLTRGVGRNGTMHFRLA